MINTQKLAIAAALLIISAITVPEPAEARGLRNNNPGNIRHNPRNDWVGQIGKDDKNFVIFDTMGHGIRATRVLLNTYYTKYNLTSIRGIITKWAPAIENDTESYIRSVALQTGMQPNHALTREEFDNILPKLMKAIFTHENGRNDIAMADIKKWT